MNDNLMNDTANAIPSANDIAKFIKAVREGKFVRPSKHQAGKKGYRHQHNLSRGERNHAEYVEANSKK